MWFTDFMRARCVEPVKRKYAGSTGPVWVRHRFPINGGITWRDAWRQDIACQRNPLFDMVRVEGAKVGSPLVMRYPIDKCA